jgi:hypothetical protein
MPFGLILMAFGVVGPAACGNSSASRTAGPGTTGNGHRFEILLYDH